MKELEQLLQSLEAQKRISKQPPDGSLSSVFSGFFTFPQYSAFSTESSESMAEKHSAIADIEVTMVERHANIKVQSRKHPKQLLKMVAGLHSLHLIVLHLNVTTVENMVLYSFCVKVKKKKKKLIELNCMSHIYICRKLKTQYEYGIVLALRQVEDESQLTSVNEIAAAVKEMVGRIQVEVQFT